MDKKRFWAYLLTIVIIAQSLVVHPVNSVKAKEELDIIKSTTEKIEDIELNDSDSSMIDDSEDMDNSDHIEKDIIEEEPPPAIEDGDIDSQEKDLDNLDIDNQEEGLDNLDIDNQEEDLETQEIEEIRNELYNQGYQLKFVLKGGQDRFLDDLNKKTENLKPGTDLHEYYREAADIINKELGQNDGYYYWSTDNNPKVQHDVMPAENITVKAEKIKYTNINIEFQWVSYIDKETLLETVNYPNDISYEIFRFVDGEEAEKVYEGELSSSNSNTWKFSDIKVPDRRYDGKKYEYILKIGDVSSQITLIPDSDKNLKDHEYNPESRTEASEQKCGEINFLIKAYFNPVYPPTGGSGSLPFVLGGSIIFVMGFSLKRYKYMEKIQ